MSHGRPRRGSLLKVFLPWRVTADLGWHEAKRDEVASLAVSFLLLSLLLPSSLLDGSTGIRGTTDEEAKKTKKEGKRNRFDRSTAATRGGIVGGWSSVQYTREYPYNGQTLVGG